MKEKTRIAVLVSGGGTNLEQLLLAAEDGRLEHGEIVVVISNNPAAYALQRAANHKVKAIVVNHKEASSQQEFECRLDEALHQHGVELIVLAGFLRILSADFVRRWPERIINVHPSLIPSFCGAGFYGLRVHEAALEYGVKVSGATVHLVNEIPDGGRILLQKAVPVEEGDTPERLQQRIMEQAEWQLLPRAVEQMSQLIWQQKRTARLDALKVWQHGCDY